MKNLILKTISSIAAILLVCTIPARADEIRLGKIGYGGNGCPAGSASVTLAPDQQSFFYFFDAFEVQAGGGNPRLARKSCNIAIPVHVPAGYSIAFAEAPYKVFADLPFGSRAQLNVERFYAGTVGPKFSRVINGPKVGEIVLNSVTSSNAIAWSRCGEDVNLRLNISLLVTTNAHQDLSLAALNFSPATLSMKILWKRCQ